MLFLVTWDFVDSSEEGGKRSLDVFSKWKPADGSNFIGFYGYADSSGGCAIIDVDSHQTLAKLTAPFVPWLSFNAKPIITVEESAQISGEALTWLSTI